MPAHSCWRCDRGLFCDVAEDIADARVALAEMDEWEPYDPYRAPIFGAEDEIWPRWAS